ncbi:membrane protein insertase YidC, partial [Octadecabacter sp.]|nr:membrane protein insertase YidC [Octadecabacter sp.]
MDDQNKNLILATALSFIVILVWFVLFPPPEATDPSAPTEIVNSDPLAPTTEAGSDPVIASPTADVVVPVADVLSSGARIEI